MMELGVDTAVQPSIPEASYMLILYNYRQHLLANQIY